MENEFQSRSFEAEVIFSRKKKKKPHHPDTIFNGNPVKRKFLPKIFGYVS